MLKRSVIVIIIVSCACTLAIAKVYHMKGLRTVTKPSAATVTLKLTSPAFPDQGRLPDRYTIAGRNISPPLSFTYLPAGTKSLALIMDDPDAAISTYTHWIIFNIPPQTSGFGENMQPAGALSGKNSSDRLGYKSPAPPSGKIHHYVFTLYALDSVLDLPEGSKKEAVEKALRGHILAEAKLTGLFSR